MDKKATTNSQNILFLEALKKLNRNITENKLIKYNLIEDETFLSRKRNIHEVKEKDENLENDLNKIKRVGFKINSFAISSNYKDSKLSINKFKLKLKNKLNIKFNDNLINNSSLHT